MNKAFALRRAALACAALFVTVTLFAAQAQAQVAPQPGPGAQPQVLSLNDPRNTYHLTPDQQRKASALNVTFESEISALGSDKSLTDKQKMAKLLEYQAAARKQFTGMLTPSQKSIYADKQKAQAAYLKGSKDAGEKADAIRKKFMASLSPSQLKKWTEFNQQGDQQLSAIGQDQTLTQQQKMQKAQALRTTMQANLKSFLTPAQVQMLTDFMRNYSNASNLQRLAVESAR